MPKGKKLWKVLAALLCMAILLVVIYNRRLTTSPQFYDGYIRLEPESERSKSYISFHLLHGNTKQKYMVLVKNPESFARVEGMLGKKVRVKAFLYENEPEDFDKIEIIEIKPL